MTISRPQRFFILSLLTLLPFVAFAQPKQNSPYSRFGLGDPLPQYFANQAAMGGQSIGFHDPFHLNLVNPASFAFLRTTALEVGQASTYSHYTSNGGSFDDWAGNLAYLALGFTLKSPINEALDRIKSPWQAGMGFAITPMTQVGYNLESNGSTGTDTVLNTFKGQGGFYRLTWSNGIKYKNTALGLNLGWVFGEAQYENGTDFFNTLIPYDNSFRDDIRLNGLTWTLGVQHDFVLRYAENNPDVPKKWITAGITGQSKNNINGYVDRLYIRHRGLLGNNYFTPDTIDYRADQQFAITLPGSVGFGLQYVEANRLRLGGEFQYQFSEQYRNEARPLNYKNTLSLSAGVEFIPDFASYNRYFNRIRYRLGTYYRQDPRPIDGQQLNDFGVSFGFGFPIVLPRQQTSFMNTAFEWGQFGANSAIEETYFRITIGFTLNDNSWFYKRRFE